jgi:REP element-mobilizing transposase RayT
MLIYVGIGEDLSAIMHRLKGTCARRIFQEFPDLKHQIRENHLWGRRFRADEVPFEALDEVKQYIRNQEDIHLNRASQMPMKRLERWKDLVDY